MRGFTNVPERADGVVGEHANNKTNPHGVTAAQVGLGNVPNVATNDQTPTFSQASTLAALVSGEKLSASMGKIMKAVDDLISHLANQKNPHGVTAAQTGAFATADSQTANTVLAAPNGSAGAATFRKLVDTDIPGLAASKITAGIFAETGVIAKTGTDYTTYRIRNIAANTTAMTASSTALSNGNVYLQYE